MTDKPFKFGLERVRELRVRDEDQAKEDLARSLAARLRGEAMLRAADERLAAHQAASRAGSGQTLAPQDLLAAQRWAERLERSVQDAAVDLRRADAEVDLRRGAVTQAAMKREAMDRLRDQKLAEHKADAQRRQDAALDELASRMHARAAGAKVAA